MRGRLPIRLTSVVLTAYWSASAAAPAIGPAEWPVASLATIGDHWFLTLTVAWSVWLAYSGKFSGITFIPLILSVSVMLVRHAPEADYSPAAGERYVRLITLNVRQFSGSETVLLATAERVRQENPDVVCLQEFGLMAHWPETDLAARQFEEALGMKYHRFDPFEGNVFGIAFFSRFPIVSVDTVYEMLSHTNAAMRYLIDVHGEKLFITNVHLQSFNLQSDSQDDLRLETVLEHQRKQVALLNQLVGDGPSCLAGDFNMPVGGRIYRSVGQEWIDAQREMGQSMLSTHRYAPVRIDYVFHNASVSVLDCHRITGFDSDHHAVIATMAF